MYILLNISRSKTNQAIGQLKEYNTRNIFMKESQTKYAGETIIGPLSKKSK